VEPSLDLVAGDRIALLPTSYKMDAHDDLFITGYDSVTGKISLESAIKYYHWGANESTAG